MKDNFAKIARNTSAMFYLSVWMCSIQTLQAAFFDNTDASMFAGQRYYVSADGNNAGTGSIEKPWQTIHQAMQSIPAEEDDATVVIRGGLYKIPQTITFDAARGGSKNKYFTLMPYKDEEVVIDGSLLTQPFSSMVSLNATSYVRIKGLTFANLKGPKSAILIEGTSHHIRIINNKLQDMAWAPSPDDTQQGLTPSNSLNPIAVIGNHSKWPVNSILIRGNLLSDIELGNGGGIKIIGNVTDFIISQNHAHNITNSGIVAAGNYAWIKDSSDPSVPLSKRLTIPADVNHARNGVIKENVIHNAVSPIVGSAGIYLDGARNITVKGNTCYNNTVGFAIDSQQPGDATGNTLRRNIAYGNTDAGLVVGASHDDSAVNNTTVIHNEFRNNQSQGRGGEITIQSVNGLDIDNNLFASRSDVIAVVSKPATNLKLNNNLYYGASKPPDTAIFDWGGINGLTYVGLSKFQAATCNDLSSVYQDASSIKYFEQIKHRSGRNKQLSKIRRACYRGNKIW